MSSWLAQHFLNAAFFWPGVALIAIPIAIHLINRLHYRRVRFAAMEFLLASEQKSRRRILFEQLLLLLLRILMVLLLVALIARMVLSDSQLSLFQGAKSHHVVLLDDSGSMRDRLGESAAFDDAKAVIRRLVSEGANRPGTQKFTLLLASRPDETLAGLGERDIDDLLVDEVSTRLEDLVCTHQAADLGIAIEAARSRLLDDRTDVKHLHVLSDFRRHDWFDNKSLAAALRALDAEGIAVNLVRTVAAPHENLSLTDLSGAVEVAAAGVPVTFSVTLANRGTRAARDVRVAVAMDERLLPMNLVFAEIPAGAEVSRTFEVVFDSAGPHRLRVALEGDALEQDNTRYIAVQVPADNPVLIIDGAPSSEQGLYLVDALAADKSVTGYAPVHGNPDYLRKSPLDGFHLIYMLNVPELPADGLAALEKYVANGGGLAWFMGNAVLPAFYNDKLYKQGKGLFPAPLGPAPVVLSRDESGTAGPDLRPTDHPIFRILAGEENPFLDLVFVNVFYPLSSGWMADVWPASPDVLPIASLRNRGPLLLEHAFGQGRVVTCLTSAGPLRATNGLPWNNWANGPAAPSYAVFQLDLARHIARRDRTLPRRIVGEPIQEVFSRATFADEVEFVAPDNHVTQIRAVPLERETRAPLPPRPPAPAPAPGTLQPLSVTFRDTDLPGVYAVRMTTSSQEQHQQLIAYNVPPEEGVLSLVTDEQIRSETGPTQRLSIQPSGVFDWIRTESPGADIRWLLLLLLAVAGACEQWMAHRLSYHPA